MSTERRIREVAAKHGLAVDKRITTGNAHRHFAAFDVYGERAAVYAAHAELVPGWSSIRPVVRHNDAEPGQVYLLLESVWCVVQNPNCCGCTCTSDNGVVRVLPIGGGGNLILCRQCFDVEQRAQGRLENWDDLQPYLEDYNNEPPATDDDRSYGPAGPPRCGVGVAECSLCGGDYSPADCQPGLCRHCIDDVPAVEGKTLCASCITDDQICPECGYPHGS